jgi:hypothetical protein
MLGVARLGGGGGQVGPEGVGVVLAQVVGHIDGGAAALAELPAAEVEVFSDRGCKLMPCWLGPAVPVPKNIANGSPF